MSDTWCTHGSHHSYCPDCLDGPQPVAPRPASAKRAPFRPTPELIAAAERAVTQALAMAPEVAEAKRRDDTDRGIDVEVDNEDHAAYLRDTVNAAIESSEFAGQVSAWVWRTGSTGDPKTPGGAAHGIEVRLQPHFANRPARSDTET